MNEQMIITKAKEMQAETGNHLMWCVGEIVRQLSDEELGELVSERDDERWSGNYARLNQPAKANQSFSPRQSLINGMEQYYCKRANR